MFDLFQTTSRRASVSLQFMSDLHLERIKYDYNIEKAASTLILAGDIGQFRDAEAYLTFLAKQCDQFDRVLLVAGNHEFYGTSRGEGLSTAQTFVESPLTRGKLHFLHRTRLDLPDTDVTILGCTLHSYIAPDYTRLTNDFAKIEAWRVRDHNAEHASELEWLKATLSNMANDSSPRRVVIVTHYAPAFEKTTHPQNEHNAISQCFSSNILSASPSWPGSDLVQFWIYGHTHWNASFQSGKVKVVSNQRCNDSFKLSWLQKRVRYRPFDTKACVRL